MVFSSIEFLFVFLPVFFVLYFAVKNLAWKNYFLLAASLFFYAWGEHTYVLLMIFFIAFNWVCALLIDKGVSRKFVLVFAIAMNLGLIGYYKYTDFFINCINWVFRTDIPLRHIPLPLGISFFTFQTLSYVIDVYRGDTKVQKNPFYLGEYVSSFPQLIAGPIVRYQTVAEEIEDRHVSRDDFAYGIRRFIIGLGKKAIIANSVAAVCDAIFVGDPAHFGFVGAWLAIVSFALQLYYDFSGYSDMAIGLGRMMGFHFLENFNYPFISRSMAEMWRRWHISLSTFFRDYLYFPMGGSRVKVPRFIFNIMVVWGLTGLWHGANINYVCWGLYIGVVLLLERFFYGKYLPKIGPVLSCVYTNVAFLIGLAIFQYEGLDKAWSALQSMFFVNGVGSMNYLISNQVFQLKYVIMLPLACFFSMPLANKWFTKMTDSGTTGRIVGDVVLLCIFAYSTMTLVSSSYNPFIYFRF